jgi:hypothetical protein
MTWPMRKDAPDAEIAERDSGHHFELSAIEVIEDGLLMNFRRGPARELTKGRSKSPFAQAPDVDEAVASAAS